MTSDEEMMGKEDQVRYVYERGRRGESSCLVGSVAQARQRKIVNQGRELRRWHWHAKVGGNRKEKILFIPILLCVYPLAEPIFSRPIRISVCDHSTWARICTSVRHFVTCHGGIGTSERAVEYYIVVLCGGVKQ
jgi:hypothetical protein